ncbi:hypothetical protein CK203_101936 [Vitis vinifera]|uniref:Uncharacterized protein n=1 Tax=Vitis vinifera TaxID=29760 RepID=A0A438BQ16_VITVI|nr:hypothetical protein CK203_101936 [Vitis vinifera]
MSKTKALNPEWKNNFTVSINFQVSSLQGEQGYPGGHRIDWKDAGHPGNSWEIIAIHFQIFVILCSQDHLDLQAQKTNALYLHKGLFSQTWTTLNILEATREGVPNNQPLRLWLRCRGVGWGDPSRAIQ